MVSLKEYTENEISKIILQSQYFIDNHLKNYNNALQIIVCRQIVCEEDIEQYRTFKNCTFPEFIGLLSKDTLTEYTELINTHDRFHFLVSDVLELYAHKRLISGQLFTELYLTHNKLLNLLSQVKNKFESVENEIDGLTKAWTRKSMQKIVEEDYCNKREFSLVYMDIDFFKNINDTYTHDGGDFILIELIKLINKQLRKNDLISRWGGEEFIIYLPDTTLDSAKILLTRIKKLIEEYIFFYKENEIQITCSFGLSSSVKHSSLEDLIYCADKLLYKAKKNGRNRIEF